MKPLFYSFILLFLPYFCMADYNEHYKIKTDKSGNIYVLGQYKNIIAIGPYILGDSVYFKSLQPDVYRCFIAKFDSSGKVLWADSIVSIIVFDGDYSQDYFNLTLDNENNVIISLPCFDSVIYYRGIKSCYRPNIIKLDSSGNLMWTKRIAEYDWLQTDVAVDGKNNIYLASKLHYSISSDNVTLVSCDTSSVKTFVAKISPTGKTKWIKEIASPIFGNSYSSQICHFITADSNGNSFVGGATNRKISLGNEYFEYKHPSYYPFLAKLDSNGNPGFLKGYLISLIDTHSTQIYLSHGCISKEQKLYVGGTFRDTVNVGPSSIVVAKEHVLTPFLGHMDVSNGNALWYQYNHLLYSIPPNMVNAPSPSFTYSKFFSLATDGMNNVFMIGRYRDSIVYYNGSNYDTLFLGLISSYFAKFDSSGNFKCYRSDSSLLVAGAAFGSSYYTIGISSTIVSSNTRHPYMYAPDTYSWVKLTKWDANTCSLVWRDSLNEYYTDYYPSREYNPKIDYFFSFSPNPSANGVFKKNIDISLANLEYSIELFDVFGRKMTFFEYPHLIDISMLPKGIYFYRATFANKYIHSGKLLYQ